MFAFNYVAIKTSEEVKQVSLCFHNAAFGINLSFAYNFPQKWRELVHAQHYMLSTSVVRHNS